MAIYKSQDLPDGACVVMDDSNPNREWPLRPGQWEEIEGLPESEQRTRLDQFVEQNEINWKRERGPDSVLGREIEQGTPEAHHDSEPA